MDRYIAALTGTYKFSQAELAAVDDRVRAEVDAATDLAEQSPVPEPLDALNGVYQDPAVMPVLWYRQGRDRAVDQNERAQGWGTWNG